MLNSTARITNPRIEQLIELSSTQSPFDRLPETIEIADEYGILSRRNRSRPPLFYPASLDRQPQYLLVYYDGQLVEVSDLVSRQVLFKNVTTLCENQVKYKHGWTPFSHK